MIREKLTTSAHQVIAKLPSPLSQKCLNHKRLQLNSRVVVQQITDKSENSVIQHSNQVIQFKTSNSFPILKHLFMRHHKCPWPPNNSKRNQHLSKAQLSKIIGNYLKKQITANLATARNVLNISFTKSSHSRSNITTHDLYFAIVSKITTLLPNDGPLVSLNPLKVPTIR